MSNFEVPDSLIEKIFLKYWKPYELIEEAGVMFAIVGNEGKFLYVNKHWEEVLGIPRDKITSTPFMEFIHPEDLNKSKEAYSIQGEVNVDEFNKRGFTNRYKTNRGDYAVLEWFVTGDSRDGNKLSIAIFKGYESR